MDRKNEIKNQQLDFITSNIENQYRMLNFGFELEYQNRLDDGQDECSCDLDDQIDQLDWYERYDTDAAQEQIWEQVHELIDRQDEIELFLEDKLCVNPKQLRTKAFKTRLRLNFTLIRDRLLQEYSKTGAFPWEYKSNFKNYWERRTTIYTLALNKTKKQFLENYFIPAQIRRINTLLEDGLISYRSEYFEDDSIYNNTDLNRDNLSDRIQEGVEEHFEYHEYQYPDETLLENGAIECSCGYHNEGIEGDRAALIEGTTGMHSGTDQSVDGGEIRTTGGNHIDSCLKNLQTVLDNFDEEMGGIEVDNNCSFHIHVKLGDIHHKFGPNMHGMLYEFLLWNLDLLPSSVVDRVENPNRHISANIAKSEKFNLIHFHSQGTIEFRFFGKIDSVNEAALCFDFVRQALEYAYRQKLNMERSTLDHWYIQQELNDIELPADKHTGNQRPITIKTLVAEKIEALSKLWPQLKKA